MGSLLLFIVYSVLAQVRRNSNQNRFLLSVNILFFFKAKAEQCFMQPGWLDQVDLACKRIETAEECEKAAQGLGLKPWRKNRLSQAQRLLAPAGCYYEKVGFLSAFDGLYFNPNLDSFASCTTERRCLCQTRGLYLST